MRALIIGAAGFVGPHLAREIRKTLRCSVIATILPRERLEIEEAEVRHLDILDQQALYRLLYEERPEYIFHLAAQSSVALSWKKPSLTVDINVKGALNLMDAVRSLGLKSTLLMVGSGEEYGHIDPDHVPIKETELLRPGNIYAASKMCQGMMGSVYARSYGMRVIMTRSFNHFGPGQSDVFVLSDFCKQAVMMEKGKAEHVFRTGNLESRRDFTDVRDVVRAYVRLAMFGRAGETYNVGSQNARRIRELLDMIIAKSSVDAAVETDPARVRPIDVPVIEADITKIRTETGWHPVIPTEQTIGDTLDWWRERL